MKFENEWIEEAVRNALGISADEELTAEAIKDIKYLKIGPSDHFINGYEIELSTHTPPIPFSDTDGGDEWICCLRGENIEAFLDQKNRNSLLQPSMFGFDVEDFDYAHSDEAEAKWEEYKTQIVKGNDFLRVIKLAESEGKEVTDKRFDSLLCELYKDVSIFTGVTVLRIVELVMPDYNFFKEMKQLKVLELVEACFESAEGTDSLKGLQQLSCWMD